MTAPEKLEAVLAERTLPEWVGPDGFRRGVIEVAAPADLRVVMLPADKLARSRWFLITSGQDAQ